MKKKDQKNLAILGGMILLAYLVTNPQSIAPTTCEAGPVSPAEYQCNAGRSYTMQKYQDVECNTFWQQLNYCGKGCTDGQCNDQAIDIECNVDADCPITKNWCGTGTDVHESCRYNICYPIMACPPPSECDVDTDCPGYGSSPPLNCGTAVCINHECEAIMIPGCGGGDFVTCWDGSEALGPGACPGLFNSYLTVPIIGVMAAIFIILFAVYLRR